MTSDVRRKPPVTTNLAPAGARMERRQPAAPNIKISGTGAFTFAGQAGSDGTPLYTITLRLASPVPAGFTKGEWLIKTDKPYPQGNFEVVPGSRRITITGFIHHSMVSSASGEYAEVILADAKGKTISARFGINLEGRTVIPF